MVILLILLFFVVVALSPFFIRKLIEGKIVPSQRTQQILLGIHIVLCLLLLVTLIMAYQEIYWRFYKSSTFLLILTVFSGTCFYTFERTSLHNNLRIIYGIFLFIGIFMGCVISAVSLSSYERDHYYEDAQFRIQDKFRGLMGAKEFPLLVEKKGLLSRRYQMIPNNDDREMFYKEDVDNILIADMETYFSVNLQLKDERVVMLKTLDRH